MFQSSTQTKHQTASERENQSDPIDGAETNENSDERKNKKNKNKRKTSEEQNGENTGESKSR